MFLLSCQLCWRVKLVNCHVGVFILHVLIFNVYKEFAWMSGGPFDCKIRATPLTASVYVMSIVSVAKGI